MSGEELLCCPVCKGSLEEGTLFLTCPGCGVSYRAVEEMWDLTPPSVSRLKVSERDHYSSKTEYYLYMHETWCDSPFYRHYHRAFLDDLRRLPPRSLILETGCGLGHDGLELLRAGYRLVETDIAPGQLAQARRLHREQGFAETSAHILADAENLPFPSGTFDGSFMVASLHHLPDPAAALREMRRVLKPGGVLVLGTEPNSWQSRTIYPFGKRILGAVKRLAGKAPGVPEAVSEADQLTEGLSGPDLERLFREAGFARWELKPAGYLSAAIYFACNEFSQHSGRTLRLFPLERLTLPIDAFLARLPILSRYPWHWNAVVR